jgi:hypothetical protein
MIGSCKHRDLRFNVFRKWNADVALRISGLQLEYDRIAQLLSAGELAFIIHSALLTVGNRQISSASDLAGAFIERRTRRWKLCRLAELGS